MCSASVLGSPFWMKSRTGTRAIIRVPRDGLLTKLNIVIAEVVDSIEAPVEDLSSSLECMEGHIEGVPSAEDNQVPHLATICSCIVTDC